MDGLYEKKIYNLKIIINIMINEIYSYFLFLNYILILTYI